MPYQILDWERPILRELAAQQAAYAALPEMRARERLWFQTNTRTGGTRPPVVIEEWTFDRDFMPASILACRSEQGRRIESQLRHAIRSYELIGDDKVVPGVYTIPWQVHIDEFGVEIPVTRVLDADGIETGYQFHHPIHDLERDLSLLRPAAISVDRDETQRHRAFLDDLFGDILPIAISCSGGGIHMFLTHRVVELMGMEAFFIAMMETPDAVHALMEYLTQNALSILHFYEREGLLTPSNGNQDSFGSSYNFTDQLPAPDWDGGALRLRDMWLACNSQETVGVSPAMFREFCLPYYQRVCAEAGLLYYGCCEPVSPLWDSISRLPHLKKVSISRWCDERAMGDALRGTAIVYSRKPDPNFLSVDRTLDEAAWAAHIDASLDAARGCQMEIIIRDVYTLHGDIGNARRAVEIARERIERREWA